MARRNSSCCAVWPNITEPISTQRMPAGRESSTARPCAGDWGWGRGGRGGGGVGEGGGAAGGIRGGQAVIGDGPAEVAGGQDGVAQVRGREPLWAPPPDGLEIATRQSAVGGEAFGENQQ